MLGCCKVIFSESTAAVRWACGYSLSGRSGEMSKTAPWCTSCSPNTETEGSNMVINSLICWNNILHPIFIYAFFKHWQRGTFVLVWETIRLWETAFCWRFSRCTELDANNPHWALFRGRWERCAERWTEMQADGGGWETINLTLTAGPLRNCIEAATPGICVCVCVCVCVCERDMRCNCVQ